MINHPHNDQAANEKLEWLEPTFELLHDPQGGPGYETYEVTMAGPS